MRRASLLLLPLLASCVTLHFDHRRGFEPVDPPTLAALRVGTADLAACLDRLGAPNLVYEQPNGGIALAWAWLQHFGWGIDASINLRGVPISGDFDGDQRNLEGAVLFFDKNLRLVSIERGLLRDFLQAPSRQPPADVD